MIRPRTGTCEMCSQNTHPVPPQSCGICSLCPLSRKDNQGLEQLCDMLAIAGNWDEDLLCQDWFLPRARDSRKRSVPKSVQSQGRPKLGDAGQEGRVTGSECYPLFGDIQTSMLGVHWSAYHKDKRPKLHSVLNNATAIWRLTCSNLT